MRQTEQDSPLSTTTPRNDNITFIEETLQLITIKIIIIFILTAVSLKQMSQLSWQKGLSSAFDDKVTNMTTELKFLFFLW